MIKQSKTQIKKANKNILNLSNVAIWRQLNMTSEQSECWYVYKLGLSV